MWELSHRCFCSFCSRSINWKRSGSNAAGTITPHPCWPYVCSLTRWFVSFRWCSSSFSVWLHLSSTSSMWRESVTCEYVIERCRLSVHQIFSLILRYHISQLWGLRFEIIALLHRSHWCAATSEITGVRHITGCFFMICVWRYCYLCCVTWHICRYCVSLSVSLQRTDNNECNDECT